jgi:hypothetical protein
MNHELVSVRWKPELVAVRWKDAHGTATAAYALHEIPHEAIEITTYGLLLRSDEKGVSVASEECKDGTYRGVTYVPIELILEVRPLFKKRGPRKPKAVVVQEN